MPKLSTKVRVSVIMPAFNTEKYIAETIESVLAQDYKHFELLIRDDKSTDNTLEIIKKFKNHPRVKIFRNTVNKGDGYTRNRLVDVAQGEYISLCDSDDIMLPSNLSRLSYILDRHQQYGAVYANIWTVEQNILMQPTVTGSDYEKNWDLIKNTINHGGSMIRKNLFQKVGGYDEPIGTCIVDWDLWLRLSEITKIKYLKDEIYYLWRRHNNSITRHGEKNKYEYTEYFNKRLLLTLKRRYGNHNFQWLKDTN